MPVLLRRCRELLDPALQKPGAVVIDATVGLGGHAEKLLAQHPQLRLVGIDRDRDALAIAKERLSRFGERVQLVHAVYDQISGILEDLGITKISGVLFDLGVSSLQLDKTERGFSYRTDAPLDMRMDNTVELTAAQILAEYDESELRRIFWNYGEEKLAPRYARRIIAERARAPIDSSARLVAIIDAATPAAAKRTGHSAKRVFQALRIEVNQELAALEKTLPQAISALEIGGRIVVLAYHSLEDRLVKTELRRRSEGSTPLGVPVELEVHLPELRLIIRGMEKASDTEIAENPRAKPARLRAAEKIRDAT